MIAAMMGLSENSISVSFRDGYVTTALGRRSYINPYDRKWENNAINSPIQGGAADFTKVWGRKVWEMVSAYGLPHSMVAFVHDETVYDTPKKIETLRLSLAREDLSGMEKLEVPYSSVSYIGAPVSIESPKGEGR